MTLVDFLLARIAESTEYWRARRVREIDRQSIDRVLAGLEAQRRIVEAGGLADAILQLLAVPYADNSITARSGGREQLVRRAMAIGARALAGMPR